MKYALIFSAILNLVTIRFIPLLEMGNMRKKIALLMLFVFFMHDLFSQCAMCKAIAEEQAEEDGSTVNSGILYIMVIPYIILFIVFRKKIFSFFKDLKKAGVAQSKD